jgi:hypothetical protein
MSEVLPRFVSLSNCTAREFDVSLGPDGGRKIFQKKAEGELCACKRAHAKIGDLAWPGGISTVSELCLGIASIAMLANSIRPTSRWSLPSWRGSRLQFPPELSTVR